MSNLLSRTPEYLFNELQQLARLCRSATSLNSVIEMAVKDRCDKVDQLIEAYREQMFASYLIGWWNASQDEKYKMLAPIMDNPTHPQYRGFYRLELGKIQICRLQLSDLRVLAEAASKVADELLNVHGEEWAEDEYV